MRSLSLLFLMIISFACSAEMSNEQVFIGHVMCSYKARVAFTTQEVRVEFAKSGDPVGFNEFRAAAEKLFNKGGKFGLEMKGMLPGNEKQAIAAKDDWLDEAISISLWVFNNYPDPNNTPAEVGAAYGSKCWIDYQNSFADKWHQIPYENQERKL